MSEIIFPDDEPRSYDASSFFKNMAVGKGIPVVLQKISRANHCLKNSICEMIG